MNGSCVVELQHDELPECPGLLCGLRTLRWEASPYHWATRRTEIKITISSASESTLEFSKIININTLFGRFDGVI